MAKVIYAFGSTQETVIYLIDIEGCDTNQVGSHILNDTHAKYQWPPTQRHDVFDGKQIDELNRKSTMSAFEGKLCDDKKIIQ